MSALMQPIPQCEARKLPQSAARSRKPLVVCVDDEVSVLASLARVFRREPIEFWATDDPETAILWIIRNPVSVLVTDERMPRMSGLELMRIVVHRSPETRLAVLTGYPDPAVRERALKIGARQVIAKPWDDRELRATVEDLVGPREERTW